ncbi:hypothetical protein 1 [Wuhan insect virus 17]|uniref:hypothetical protein 1 n=1 Tax=Wuhan insect virus 17 TaxID=1923721 RepID=UPI00090B7447|nr:hypothetical protein 1 [Wuhan insect virus 17]APG75920.1 hypothetical protein 1 [Wuhan insect virus 17]
MDPLDCGIMAGVAEAPVDVQRAVADALAQAIAAHQLRYPGVLAAVAEIGGCVGGVVKAAAKAVGGAVLSMRSPTLVEAGLAVALVGVGAKAYVPALKKRVRGWRKPAVKEPEPEQPPAIVPPPEIAELLREEYVPESTVAGSEFIPMERPTHQVCFGIHEWDAKLGRLGFKVMGAGCLVKWTLGANGSAHYYVIVHEHTLVHSSHMVGHNRYPLDYKVELMRNSLQHLDLKCLPATVFHQDHVAIELTQSQVSQLGLAPVRRIGVLDKRTSVAIVGPNGLGSSGDAEMISDGSIGQMSYTGSTIGGFSGCAYVSGSAVFGIHQAGGARNTGYTLSYLLKKLMLELGFCKRARVERVAIYVCGHPVYTPPCGDLSVPESSDQYFKDLYMEKVPIKWETWGVDEVLIEIRGRTSVHDVGTLRRKFGRAWLENLSKPVGQRHARDFDDSIPECAAEPLEIPSQSGESRSPGALSESASSQGVQACQLAVLTATFATLSPELKAAFLTQCAQSMTSCSSPVRQETGSTQA